MDLQKFSEQLDGYRTADPAVRDQRLEHDCLILLSRMQLLLERVATKSSQDDMKATLEAGKALLVELLEYNIDFGQGYLFGEPRLSKEPPEEFQDPEEAAAAGY